jgi:hypothetical protein
MKKLFLLFVLCAAIGMVQAQVEVGDTVDMQNASAQWKSLVRAAGNRAAKGETLTVDADSIYSITLCQNVHSREKGTDGKAIVEDQYLIIFWAKGKKDAILTTEDPTQFADVTDLATFITYMSQSGVYQGDDEIPVSVEMSTAETEGEILNF